MLKRGHIYLMGLMGSGKSKLGKQLAPKFNLPFVDLDKLIEKRSKRKIAEIFATDGEAAFRKLEQEALFSLNIFDEGRPMMISLGGGTPCNEDNIRFIQETGFGVYLKVPVPVLVSRLKDKTDDRPLLAGKSSEEIEAFLNKQLKERQPYYRKASNMTVDFSGNIKIGELAEAIMRNWI